MLKIPRKVLKSNECCAYVSSNNATGKMWQKINIFKRGKADFIFK